MSDWIKDNGTWKQTGGNGVSASEVTELRESLTSLEENKEDVPLRMTWDEYLAQRSDIPNDTKIEITDDYDNTIALIESKWTKNFKGQLSDFQLAFWNNNAFHIKGFSNSDHNIEVIFTNTGTIQIYHDGTWVRNI